MRKIMFDTNIFSNLSNGRIKSSQLQNDWKPVATHVQWDEIQATKEPGRRAEIVAVFDAHLTEKVSTSSAVWDVSAWDAAEWTGLSSAYASILRTMDEMKPDENNIKDALIADTCLQKGFGLVTNDGTLAAAARTHGIEVFALRKAAK